MTELLSHVSLLSPSYRHLEEQLHNDHLSKEQLDQERQHHGRHLRHRHVADDADFLTARCSHGSLPETGQNAILVHSSLSVYGQSAVSPPQSTSVHLSQPQSSVVSLSLSHEPANRPGRRDAPLVPCGCLQLKSS